MWQTAEYCMPEDASKFSNVLLAPVCTVQIIVFIHYNYHQAFAILILQWMRHTLFYTGGHK